MVNLKNKVVIVTGAGSGIGAAVAKLFLKEKAIVYVVGRKISRLKNTCEEARTLGYLGQSIIQKCDVTIEKDVKKVFKNLKEKSNRLDFLFNNAGIGMKPVNVSDVNYKDWKKVIDTNINGMFLFAKYSYKIMKKQEPKGGRIINNGSISSFTPRPGSAAYTTSKHAITGLTKSISLDGRKDRVICSQIDIGNAATYLTESFQKGIIQANGTKLVEPTINVENVALSVIHICKMPLNTNVLNTTIMANNMPFVGRG